MLEGERLWVELFRRGVHVERVAAEAQEIYDEEDSEVVRRSQESFRTSADAWAAGMMVLQTPD